MLHDQEAETAYRADIRVFLEFCQDTHPGAPLSERSLRLWLQHLETSDAAPEEQARMRNSIKTLFHHLGVLPDDRTV